MQGLGKKGTGRKLNGSTGKLGFAVSRTAEFKKKGRVENAGSKRETKIRHEPKSLIMQENREGRSRNHPPGPGRLLASALCSSIWDRTIKRAQGGKSIVAVVKKLHCELLLKNRAWDGTLQGRLLQGRRSCNETSFCTEKLGWRLPSRSWVACEWGKDQSRKDDLRLLDVGKGELEEWYAAKTLWGEKGEGSARKNKLV